MPVRPEQGRAPKYVLVLFTRNDHGVWFFADALGRAGRYWQEALHEERARKLAARHEARTDDAPPLFELDEFEPSPPAPFDRDQYERENRDRWETTITANLVQMFAARGSGLRLVDHIDEVYGDVLGQAWERHVRTAVKRLHKRGVTTDDGKGDDFWKRPLAVRIPHHRPPPPTDSRTEAGRGLDEEAG